MGKKNKKGKIYSLLFLYCLKKALANGMGISKIPKANPGLKLGGLSGSKHEIHKDINKNYLLKMLFLPRKDTKEEKIRKLKGFMKKEKIKFPIIIKPDRGRCAKGVLKIDSLKEFKKVLDNIKIDYLVQGYSNYKNEFGLFYYNLNNKGKILSLFRKELPYVIGDGKSNISELIKEKEGDINLFLKKETLKKIPKKNKKIILSDTRVFNESRTYPETPELKTNKLLKKIEQSIKNTRINYCRFDLIAKNDKELKKGNFKIIEVNGINSMNTIWHNDEYSEREAIDLLYKQVDLLIKIAKENKKKNSKKNNPFEALFKFVVNEKKLKNQQKKIVKKCPQIIKR